MESRSIPKIIHFIWAGGNEAMPRLNRNAILAWKETNPNCRIMLWVDKKSCSPNIMWSRIQHAYEPLISAGIILADIEDAPNISNNIIRYEIDRLRPNYGASSDLLRYRILHQYGGAYFDSDVLPGKFSLEQSKLFETRQDHVLYVDHNSQNTGHIGNDALATTPYNPLMLAIYQQAEKHYRDADQWYNTLPILTHYYDEHQNNGYIEKSTIYRTGPSCVQRICLDERENAPHHIQYLDSLVAHKKNDRLWINKPLKQLSQEECLRLIIMSVEFEAEHFNILRLDDHIDNLKSILNCDRSQAANLVLNLIKESDIDLHKIVGITINCSHPETIDYCKKNGLLEKTFLLPPTSEQELSGHRNSHQDTLNHIFSSDYLENLLKTDEHSARTTINRSISLIQMIIDNRKLWGNSPIKINYLDFLQEKAKEMIHYIAASPNKELYSNLRSQLEKMNAQIDRIKLLEKANKYTMPSPQSFSDQAKIALLLNEREEMQKKKHEATEPPAPSPNKRCNLL